MIYISIVIPSKNSRSVANSESPLLNKLCKMTDKTFEGRFLSMPVVTLSKFKRPQLPHFWDYNLYFSTNMISRLKCATNIHRRNPTRELKLIWWERVTYA